MTLTKLLIVIFLSASTLIFADIENMHDIIKDPAISRRCKALLQGRTDKIKYQQKISSLILRNKKLQKKLTVNQKTLVNSLELNAIQLKNNLRLSELRLKSMEENIVRKGCPGIVL